jgi:hypothetical protein
MTNHESVGRCQHCNVQIFDRDDADRHQDAMSHLCWKCVKPHGVYDRRVGI